MTKVYILKIEAVVIPGRQAAINTYIWNMHSQGFDVFVKSPRQWEVQKENVNKTKQKKHTNEEIFPGFSYQKITSSVLTLVLEMSFPTMLKQERKYL